MFKTDVVASRPGTLSMRRPDAPAPRTEAFRSAALAARATFEVIGFLSVVLILALCLSPGLRLGVGQVGSALWANFSNANADDAAADEADAADEPHAGHPLVLEPANQNVAGYLARRYHVAEGAVRLMVATAQSAGKERQVDPLLILAVVAVESSMNPFAQSPVGATGLMQVMPDLHGGKFGDVADKRDALDPVANIRVGSQILAELIRRGGSVERGLQLYVGAGNAPDDGGYAARVLAEMSRLRLAASGGVAAALAAAYRADHASESGEPVAGDSAGAAASSAGKARTI